MKPLVVVDIFDKIRNSSLHIFHGAIFPKMYFLRFWGFDKTFNISIVKEVAFAAHAGVKLIRLELSDVIFGRILHAMIGMMNAARRWIALVNGHAQSRKCQLRIQMG